MNIRKFASSLFGQVLFGIVGGVLVGALWPGKFLDWFWAWEDAAPYIKALGDIFLRAIRMVLGPIVLCIVVVGMARAGGAKQLGRVGAKAMAYFFGATILSLLLGWAAAALIRPGEGFGADMATLDPAGLAQYEASAQATQSNLQFFINMMPNNAIAAFAQGDILQILVFSIFLGLAFASMGSKADRIIDVIDTIGHALFRVVGFVMRFAPIAAFGAIAYVVGEFGIETLGNYTQLIFCLYAASAIWLVAFLWPVCRFGAGLSVWKLMAYIREEIFITLGTISSAAVLPRLLEKMQQMGCKKPVVGLVLPAAYSFNMTGSAIYMTIAPIFIAQALGIDFSWQEILGMVFFLIFASKAMAGVAGSSMVVMFLALDNTASLPTVGLLLILGIDRIQNEVRSVLNMIGNVVATAVMARWENGLDVERARAVLNGEINVEDALETGDDVSAEGLAEHARELKG